METQPQQQQQQQQEQQAQQQCHCTVWRLANKRREQLKDGTYVYCPADGSLSDYSLRPTQVYIARRWLQALTYVKGTFALARS